MNPVMLKIIETHNEVLGFISSLYLIIQTVAHKLGILTNESG